MYEIKYLLPNGLTCSQCVLQWKYVAGNNWGMCPNGTGAVGCGPQEEFRACADVSITDLAGGADETPFYNPTTKTETPETEKETTKQKEETTPSVDENEIPDEPVDKSHAESTQAKSGESVLVMVFIMGVTLLVVVILFALLYVYYYHANEHLRSWWKNGGSGLRDGSYWNAIKSSIRSCSGKAAEKANQKSTVAPNVSEHKSPAPPLPPPRTKKHSIGFVGVPENLV